MVTKEAIRVLVVEDHHVVRQGLVALLNVAEGLEVVGEAADGGFTSAANEWSGRDPAAADGNAARAFYCFDYL